MACVRRAVGGTACPVRVVERREEARAEYQEAVRAGRTAAHVQLSARHANLFTVALHVAARDKAAFTLTYEQLLAREHGRYRLRLLLDPGQVVQRLLVEARIRDSAPLALVRVAKLRAADSEVDDAAEAPDDPLATVQRPSPTEALVRWAAGEEARRGLATGDGLRGLLEVRLSQLLPLFNIQTFTNPPKRVDFK
ncbi:hypothetical protein R5R35_010575 [Gryllus longicercus]|uniref:VIT domain-containing protein n=1 Tax=Gryllus longicercus TaxID=2509291 RepID=A0AAN9VD67_9ORTH